MRRVVVVALACLVLASCYFPERFEAEVALVRSGDYRLIYDGVLTWAPLYSEVAQDSLSPAEAQDKQAIIRRDLARDPDFERLESLGQGRFRVLYRDEGTIGAPGLVTFLRRNEDLLTIQTGADGTATVRAKTILPAHQRQLAQVGLGMRGMLRVVTDAAVIDHNATAVRRGSGFTLYEWTIDSLFSPAPKIRLDLNRAG